MLKFNVSFTSAVSEPRPVATTATKLVGFLDGTALRAHRIGHMRRGRWCLHTSIGQEHCHQNHCLVFVSELHVASLELTFTGPQALNPPMLNVFIADTSALFVPSTARSAATDFAGFLERATRWTRRRIPAG